MSDGKARAVTFLPPIPFDSPVLSKQSINGWGPLMQLLKSALLASVACAIAAPGFAADLSRPVPYTKAPIAEPVSAYSWSGFYLGANAGAKWANFREDFRSGTLAPLDFRGDSQVSWLA